MLTYCLATSMGLHAQETRQFKAIYSQFMNPDPKVVMITAHRGVHNECPENSLVSFRKGIDLGIDIVEMDVRHTKDDSLVIMHDERVDRTTDGKGKVSELSFAEIRQLHLKFNGQVTEEKVPTLEEALLVTKGRIMVDLDVKTDRFDAIMQVVSRLGAERTVFFLVYEAGLAKMLKEHNTAYKTLVRTYSVPQIDSLFAVTKTEAVHIDPSQNQVEAIANIRRHGARAFINALDETDKKAVAGDEDAFGLLIGQGASIVQTNYPALLKAYLQKKKRYRK